MQGRTRRRLGPLTLALCAVPLLSGFAAAPHVELRGRVTAGDGRPLAGAMVTARDLGRGITTAGTTDGTGRYRLGQLLPGTYQVAAVHDGAEIAVRDSIVMTASLTVDLRATEPRVPRAPSSARILGALPDGEEKRRFILDCTGCHQMDERVAGDRSVDEWDEAITRMLRYAGASTGFPVISAHREPRSTAEWLTRHLQARRESAIASRPAPEPAPVGDRARAVITEYELAAPRDLPHDVAVTHNGSVVITGMMTHRLYVLDPADGSLETIAIPVERANPRALEIDARGDWWVLLGGPQAVMRYRPVTDQWTRWDIGMYPHSIALDREGRAWFNGHFTRAPELIGHVGPDTGRATLAEVPPHPRLAVTPGGPIPYELRVGPDGRVWMSELQGNRLIAHWPGTDEFEVFEMPVPHSGPRRFDIDGRGILWIPAYAANALVRLDPSTREFTTYPLPTPDAVPYVARVDSGAGTVWVGTAAADAVFAFDIAEGAWTTYPLPSRGALVRHIAIDPRAGDVWLAYGASPGIAARVARLRVGAGPPAP